MKLMIGVDLGGTNMSTALVDPSGRILFKSSVPTEVSRGPADVLRRMASEIRKVATAAGYAKKDIGAVGVGSPGPLSAARGVVLETPNLVGWLNVPLTRIIAKKTGFKVFLENDANAAALGESVYGAGRGMRQIVVLTLGTGVGGGIILDGRLYSGPDSTAGELGHVVVDPKGPRCGCGQRGCLEQYASATALARRARQLVSRRRSGPLWRLCGGVPSRITGKMAHDALLAGDHSAKKAWDEASWALGTVVAAILNIFNPERVILGGGVMQAGQELLRGTREQALQRAFPQPAKRARIVRAELGSDAGVIGAAEIARRALAQ